MTTKIRQTDVEMLTRLLVHAERARDAGMRTVSISANEARNVQRLINYVVERGFEVPPEVRAAIARLGFTIPQH